MIRNVFSMTALLISLTGCAILHHAQVGEVDNRAGYSYRQFDIKISETGINIQEAGNIAKSISRSPKGSQAVDDAVAIIGLFQQGPRTGNTVFNDTYAQSLIYKIQEECPGGQVTGLNAIRETRKYPVISGEIVKITGYCMTKKKA